MTNDDDYVRGKLEETIEANRRTIVDKEAAHGRTGEDRLIREIEYLERENKRLQAKIDKLGAGTARPEPPPLGQVPPAHGGLPEGPNSRHDPSPDSASGAGKAATQSQRPSLLAAVVIWLVAFVVILVTLALVVNFLKDRWNILTVFLVFVLAFILFAAAVGVSTGQLQGPTWLKAILAVLGKVPGLDVLVGSVATLIRDVDKDNSAPQERKRDA